MKPALLIAALGLSTAALHAEDADTTPPAPTPAATEADATPAVKPAAKDDDADEGDAKPAQTAPAADVKPAAAASKTADDEGDAKPAQAAAPAAPAAANKADDEDDAKPAHAAAPTAKPTAASKAADDDEDEDTKPKLAPHAGAAAGGAAGVAATGGDSAPGVRGPVFEDVSKVTGDYIDPDLLPDAPNPLTIFGDGFWEPGRVSAGRFTPTLIVYGDVRAAYAAFGQPDSGHDSDVATLRVKPTIEADLALTASERIHARFQPLTSHEGRATGFEYEPTSDWDFERDLQPATLFFEGELDSLVSDFGGAAQHDTHDLNLALAAGRFPLELHNGYLISDVLTGVGITKNNIQVPWASDFGVGLVYAFRDVSLTSLPTVDDQAFQLLVLHGFADLAYVRAEASLSWLGVRRSGEVPGGSDRQQFFAGLSLDWLRGAVGQGLHLFGQIGNESVTGNGALAVYESNYTLSPMHVDGGAYLMVNAFYGTRRWTSISGNLDQIGTTFQSDGLTGFPHLRDDGHDSAGGAVSLEFKTLRRRLHIIPEIAWLDDLATADNNVLAAGLRVNYGFGRRSVVRVDLRRFFPQVGEAFDAGRVEYQVKF